MCDMRSARTRLILLVTFCTAATPTLEAAELPEYDLRSLALLSDFILLVEQSEKETEPGGSKVMWCRVKKAYKGKVPAGELFPRPRLDSYHCEPPKEAPKWDPEAVLFLALSGERKEWDPQAIQIVPSGLRLFAAGNAYLFTRPEIPGGYHPRPASREATDEEVFLDRSPGVQIQELEADLEAALKKVGEYEAALKSDPAIRRESLLKVLGPRLPAPVFEDSHSSTFWNDAFTARVVESIRTDGDLAATLEAFSRCPAMHLDVKERLDSRVLLEVAADPAKPVHHRVTALRIATSSLHLEPGDYPLLVRLLADELPEVRRAAALLCSESLGFTSVAPDRKREERRPLVAGLLAAFAREKDPLTRTVIFSAGNEDFYAALPRNPEAPRVIFEGCVHDLVAYCVLAFPGKSPEQNFTAYPAVAIAVPAGGGEERRGLINPQDQVDPDTPMSKEAFRKLMRAVRSILAMDAIFKQIESHYLFFEPPLPKGRYRMHLESRIVVQTGDKTEEVVLRTAPVEVAVTGEE